MHCRASLPIPSWCEYYHLYDKFLGRLPYQWPSLGKSWWLQASERPCSRQQNINLIGSFKATFSCSKFRMVLKGNIMNRQRKKYSKYELCVKNFWRIFSGTFLVLSGVVPMLPVTHFDVKTRRRDANDAKMMTSRCLEFYSIRKCPPRGWPDTGSTESLDWKMNSKKG